MDIDFECTQCGKCCHDLKLPLSVSEALAWLRQGHEVQVLCEAIPWPTEPADSDRLASNRRRRSFTGRSGSLPVRVTATLAASFEGACPHLQADMRCGNYEARPSVCRIYPAEMHPFLDLAPSSKACPDDAWRPGRRPFVRAGALVDATLRSLIEQAREAEARDVPVKAQMCVALGLDAAAMANEGFAVHTPQRAALLDALLAATPAAPRGGFIPPAEPPHLRWRFVSNQRETVDALIGVGAVAMTAAAAGVERFDYLGLRVASP